MRTTTGGAMPLRFLVSSTSEIDRKILKNIDRRLSFFRVFVDFTGKAITGRVVSGDFSCDDDGDQDDDIAATYDLGGGKACVDLWLSKSSRFDNVQGLPIDYLAPSVTGRVVSGDFDGDGQKKTGSRTMDVGDDDIAAIAADRARIDVWLGESGKLDGPVTWSHLGEYDVKSRRSCRLRRLRCRRPVRCRRLL